MRRWSGEEQWVVWVGRNDEQEYMAKLLGDTCVSITGSMEPEEKVELQDRWLNGEFQTIITKPSIFGMGVNWQHCARMAFVGMSDSYEQYYQAIRRCYRYGQTRVVHAHVIVSALEAQIVQNVKNKERQAVGLTSELVAEMRRVRDQKGIAS